MKAARKNVTLLSSQKHGIHTFELLGPEGMPMATFETFAYSLRGSPYNTRKQYCSFVADFFDYYFEAVLHLTDFQGQAALTRQQLSDIIYAWRDYLTEGPAATNSLAAIVSTTLPPELVCGNTASAKHAALTKLLRLSERLRQHSVDFAELGLRQHKAEVDYLPLLAELHQLRVVGNAERAEMRRTSALAGIDFDRADLQKEALFSSTSIGKFDNSRAFPLDRAHEFIDELRSYRDKALYSFYAAGGPRSYEATQLLWEDIDIANGEVRLVSPFSRADHPSYRHLTKLERDLLAWKGRETSHTFLIEPFASLFFENLERYHRDEYYPHGHHQFVFQIRRRPQQGRPYFLTDTKTRQQVFNRVAEKMMLPSSIDGPHSFRHGYGSYLLNYMPVVNKEYGLPLGLVRVAMGHADIKSTEKYAVADKDLLLAKFQFANLQVFHRGEIRGQLQFKVDALQKQIDKLKVIAAGISK